MVGEEPRTSRADEQRPLSGDRRWRLAGRPTAPRTASVADLRPAAAVVKKAVTTVAAPIVNRVEKAVDRAVDDVVDRVENAPPVEGLVSRVWNSVPFLGGDGGQKR